MAPQCPICSEVQEFGEEMSQNRQNNLGLLLASLLGHEDCVQNFIGKKADVNYYSNDILEELGHNIVPIITRRVCLALYDGTPLMYASAYGHIEIVKLLVNEGANVNMIKSQTTALGMAAGQGHYECVKFLIEAGASVNIADSAVKPADVKPTLLEEAAKLGNRRITSLIVRMNTFPLHAAVSGGLDEDVEELLHEGADVNQSDTNGSTPLHSAVDRNGRFLEEILEYRTPGLICLGLQPVRKLLEVGAQINRKDCTARNALTRATMDSKSEDHLNLCKLLYAAGETLDGPTVREDEIPEYFQELKEKRDLKHLCREAIRKYLIDLDPHKHLFGRIPKLGLPSIVTKYMLYDCTLDSKEALIEAIVDRDPGFR